MKRVLVLLAVGALALAACGDDDDSSDSQSTSSREPATTDRSTASSAPSSTAAAGPATIKAGESTLGEIAVDAEGKSLYLFTNDTGTTSAAPEGLLAAWPPLIAEGEPVAGEGIDASKLGTAEQPNGQTWVTYNDHLLYRFTGDAAPGDVAGQGVGGVWYVVSAAGDRIG